MYKNRALIHCQHNIWVDMNNNSYVYVVSSHSMSVDWISHFTPQKIFNKSKKRKEGYNDRRASVSVLWNWVLHRKLVPKFLRVHWRNFVLLTFFTLLVFKRYRTTPCRCQFETVTSPSPTGNSLVQIRKNGRKERWGGPATSGEAPPLQRQEEKEPSSVPAPRSCKQAPCKCKIQSHVSSLNRYISVYQANSKMKQNHSLTEKD